MNRHLIISLFSLVLLAPAASFAASGATMGDMIAVLDIGQYIRIRNTGPIKVLPNEASSDPFTNFQGCRKVDVDCNFRAHLRVSAKAVSEAQGQWTASISPSHLEMGTTRVEVCVAGTNVMTHYLMGGQTNVPVAEVTIQVMAL